jgi:hypothetical protein
MSELMFYEEACLATAMKRNPEIKILLVAAQTSEWWVGDGFTHERGYCVISPIPGNRAWHEGHTKRLLDLGVREVVAVDYGLECAAHDLPSRIKVRRVPDIPVDLDGPFLNRYDTHKEDVDNARLVTPLFNRRLPSVLSIPNDDLPFTRPPWICEAVSESPKWLIPGLLAAGAVTELSGKPKMGKSNLAWAITRAITSSGDFLGQKVRRGRVVYLTEESNRSLAEVLGRNGLSDNEDVDVLLRGDRGVFNKPWPELAEKAIEYALWQTASLLVIDTLSVFTGVDDENDAAQATRAFAPLNLAAQSGLAVLYTRHDRKSGGAVGDSGRGSSAYAGAADNLLQLTRADSGSHPNRRVIRTLGRFDDVPSQLIIELENGEYVFRGTDLSVDRLKAREVILNALRGTESAMTEPEFRKLDDSLSRPTIQRALNELLEERQVSREMGHGTKGNAYGYLLGTPDSATD